MKGSGQAQKEKCVKRKARVVSGLPGMGGMYAGREKERVSLADSSATLRERIVVGSGEGEVRHLLGHYIVALPAEHGHLKEPYVR